MVAQHDLDRALVEGSPLVLRHSSSRKISLEGQDLRGSDFVLADLTGASLARSDVSFSTLAGAILRHSDMSRVRAMSVNLSYTDLSYADLSHSNLVGASDVGTVWDGANLEGCTLPEGWLYEDFVNEVAPNFFIECGLALKSIVSDRGWTTGPIELAYPDGVPTHMKPVERRMRIFMASGHLRRAQVTSALRKKGALR